MARQGTLFDLARSRGQENLSLVGLSDIVRRLRALAAGDAAPNPFGLTLSAQDARVIVDTIPSPRGTDRLGAVLQAFLVHRPSGPVTVDAVSAWKPYGVWQEWAASLKPSWSHPTAFGVKHHDAFRHLEIVARAVSGLGGWHEKAYRTLLLEQRPGRVQAILEERVAAWERYVALLERAALKGFEDLRPGDRILEWRGLEDPGILICTSEPHDERGSDDPFWRHVDTVEEVDGHGPMKYAGMFEGFSETERAALYKVWPFRGGQVRAFGHKDGILCLEPTAAALPSEADVYEVTRRLISPQKADYPAIGALHGLEHVFAPYLCDHNPFAAAMKRGFDDTLAAEWQERFQGESHKRAPRPELLQSLAPLAHAVVPMTDWRAVREELKQWVLPEGTEYGYVSYLFFTPPTYTAPVLYGALAAATTDAEALDVLARAPGGMSMGQAANDPGIQVLAMVPPPPPRTRKMAEIPAIFDDLHRAGRGRGRFWVRRASTTALQTRPTRRRANAA